MASFDASTVEKLINARYWAVGGAITTPDGRHYVPAMHEPEPRPPEGTAFAEAPFFEIARIASQTTCGIALGERWGTEPGAYFTFGFCVALVNRLPLTGDRDAVAAMIERGNLLAASPGPEMLPLEAQSALARFLRTEGRVAQPKLRLLFDEERRHFASQVNLSRNAFPGEAEFLAVINTVSWFLPPFMNTVVRASDDPAENEQLFAPIEPLGTAD